MQQPPRTSFSEDTHAELQGRFRQPGCKTRLSEGQDRRGFIKTALGTGFAAAALPVCAQTMIKTDSEGLTAGEVSIDVNGQKVPVYRAQPAGKTNLPVILVVSEIFGVHEHIADVARRFAKLGYLALAPELFVRQGDAKDTVEKMKVELAKGSSKSEFVIFPNSGHAFHADYRPSYVEADAKEGWKHCLEWFKTHGVA